MSEDIKYKQIEIVPLPESLGTQYTKSDIEKFQKSIEDERPDSTLIIISDYPLVTELVLASEEEPDFIMALRMKDNKMVLSREEIKEFNELAKSISEVFYLPVIFEYIPR